MLCCNNKMPTLMMTMKQARGAPAKRFFLRQTRTVLNQSNSNSCGSNGDGARGKDNGSKSAFGDDDAMADFSRRNANGF